MTIHCHRCGKEIQHEMFIAGRKKRWHMRCYKKNPEKTKKLVRAALSAGHNF